jgi:hypothetical protein
MDGAAQSMAVGIKGLYSKIPQNISRQFLRKSANLQFKVRNFSTEKSCYTDREKLRLINLLH